jgi:hypothetical protein
MAPLVVLVLLHQALAASSPPSTLDTGPLGDARQVVVGDRLPRVLELLATDAGVVVPMQTGTFAISRARHLLEHLRLRSSSSLDIVDGPLRLSPAEDAALRFGLRSFAVLDDGRAALQLSPTFGLEVAGRSAAAGAAPRDLGARDRLPVLGIDASAVFGLLDDLVLVARSTVELRQDPMRFAVDEPASSSNIVEPAQIDVRFPHRAMVGVAGPGFGLHVGRDRLDLGNGRMGNLLLADTVDFHDHVRVEVYLPAFTWTSLILRLDPTLLPGEQTLPGMNALIAPQKHLVVHRVEGVVLEKLHLAATEGWMVGGVPLDLRHLNPLSIFHNQFAWNDVDAYRSASVMVALEATLTPVRGMRLWGQYAINQVQSPLERLWYPDGASEIADATALLGGLELTAPVRLWWPRMTLQAPWSSWTKPAGVAHVYGGAEFVETSPYFGLRENPLTTWAARQRVPSNVIGGTGVVEAPLGFRDGPDSRTLRLWVGVLDVGLGEVELGVEQREKGEQTLRSPYREGDEAVALSTPTGTSTQSRVFTARLELLPLRLERVSATVRLDWRRFVVENAGHVVGARVVDDQLVMGVRLDL